MTEKKYTLEDTTEVKQGDAKVHPIILVIYAILVVTCIVYFITHLTRGA